MKKGTSNLTPPSSGYSTDWSAYAPLCKAARREILRIASRGPTPAEVAREKARQK